MEIKERFKIIPSVHLFLVRKEEILLLKRCSTGYEDGNWSVPAGHLDGDELAADALIREAKEETGITVDPRYLKMVHVMHRKTEKEENERVDFFFTAKRWKGEVENREPQKCSELRWVPFGKLPLNTIPYVRDAIEQYRENVFFSEFGWKSDK